MTSRVDTLAPSAARTSSGTGSLMPSFGENLALQVDVTAVSGTTPSMTLRLEWSNDGTVWTADADTFPEITETGSALKQYAVKAAYVRLGWTITGTTPSFTFAATAFVR